MRKQKLKDLGELKIKVKYLLRLARKKGLIKSHVLAFEDTPVEQEEHMGKFTSYVSN